MLLPTLDFQNKDFNIFIKQWSSFYNYDKMNLYDDNIDKPVLKRADLIQLYVWKNGSTLSKRKMESLENKVLIKLHKINELKQNFSIPDFLTEFENVSFVWKIFLLHIIRRRNIKLLLKNKYSLSIIVKIAVDYSTIINPQ